jgi:hypothetical protein
MSSKARLVITAVVVEKRPVAHVVRDYGVSRSWVYELLARYRAEGEAAFEPRSRRPKRSPRATSAATVEPVLRLRKQLAEQGLDAGADTTGWHLDHHHNTMLSRATINRILTRHGAVTRPTRISPAGEPIEVEHARAADSPEPAGSRWSRGCTPGQAEDLRCRRLPAPGPSSPSPPRSAPHPTIRRRHRAHGEGVPVVAVYAGRPHAGAAAAPGPGPGPRAMPDGRCASAESLRQRLEAAPWYREVDLLNPPVSAGHSVVDM